MHHVSTHISTLALSVNCSCTDLDLSSSFDGLDWGGSNLSFGAEPRRVFKSFGKDSTRRSVVIIIQGGRNGLSQRHVPLGAEAPTEGLQSGGGRMRCF
ncbi:unnamed protein product [Brassica rapa]|uniref:Uncharacterized protein n=1 Tax=Brassica campestris TaxID=3711 RepID=A0A8D9D8I8_BRACM|nr:unnamed protein product [Brassica rapa]